MQVLHQYVEVIGLLATLLVLLSFLFTGEKVIRVINIAGATVFVVYGLILGTLSVWLLNAALIIVHFYKLYKLKKVKTTLDKPERVFTYNNQQIQTIRRVKK